MLAFSEWPPELLIVSTASPWVVPHLRFENVHDVAVVVPAAALSM